MVCFAWRFVFSLYFCIAIALQLHCLTNKEREENMPEITHDREERMQAVIDAATASKESATEFLIRAGVLDPSGEWAPHLR